MNTKPDCIICILKQFLQISRQTGVDESRIQNGFFDLVEKIPDMASSMSPPELAVYINELNKKYTGIDDPYFEIKEKSNAEALQIYPDLKKRVETAKNPFAEALCLAIAGNLIDFGANAFLDLKDTLDEILNQPLFHQIETGESFNDETFQLKNFYDEIVKAEKILYLGDNAGEIVFDRIFIETIKSEFPQKEIIFVYRGGPALNDVLEKDTREAGLDRLVKTISSGCAAAGTILSKCSDELLDEIERADIIISKGQGNFEALSGEPISKIWFLFRIKCRAVAAIAGAPEGSLILRKNAGEKNRNYTEFRSIV